MEIKFNFKSFEPSDYLKDYILNRFEKLEKYIRRNDSAQLQINLEVEKFRQMAEAILNADDINITARDETEDMYATIDSVLDKMETQLRKIRGKKKDQKRGKNVKNEEREIRSVLANEVPTPEPEEGSSNVVKTDNFEPKPMSVEEAISRMEEMNHAFIVFFNAETNSNRVNVIYRRKNGDYGLIDPRM